MSPIGIRCLMQVIDGGWMRDGAMWMCVAMAGILMGPDVLAELQALAGSSVVVLWLLSLVGASGPV